MSLKDIEPSASGSVDRIVLYRLDSIDTTMRDLAAQVGRLVLIEERQSKTAEAMERAFGVLAKHDERLRALELAQPITDRTNVWVERALLAIVSAAGAAFFILR